ncbi:putative transcription factor MYB/SANT family [Helianthus annuus]|nr:putative transcription factor MYB/SANT family [Helianthus annuus]
MIGGHLVLEGPAVEIVLSTNARFYAIYKPLYVEVEEESFFNALRQVGKNFEKITSRVQSKNKDQVKHYYYHLVRRMNKLFDLKLSLDAKNSKYTNATMLRWWLLLEKYSSKVSKLHLKPRRFNHFLESLEYQLLKDRKKNIKK